ncbi:MAG: methylmalonic aciduria and homocystinuria type D protein [Xenococcaceae cyanobacterium]
MNLQKFNNTQDSFHIDLIEETGLKVQISIHEPTEYIKENRQKIIPNWESDPVVVIVVLQQSKHSLTNTGPHIEKEKDRLRKKFIYFGCALTSALNNDEFLADLIDPRNGYPLFTRPGKSIHDDVATASTLLGYTKVPKGECSMLNHPEWGTAVYPSTLISSASPEKIQPFIKEIAVKQGWKEFSDTRAGTMGRMSIHSSQK